MGTPSSRAPSSRGRPAWLGPSRCRAITLASAPSVFALALSPHLHALPLLTKSRPLAVPSALTSCLVEVVTGAAAGFPAHDRGPVVHLRGRVGAAGPCGPGRRVTHPHALGSALQGHGQASAPPKQRAAHELRAPAAPAASGPARGGVAPAARAGGRLRAAALRGAQLGAGLPVRRGQHLPHRGPAAPRRVPRGAAGQAHFPHLLGAGRRAQEERAGRCLLAGGLQPVHPEPRRRHRPVLRHPAAFPHRKASRGFAGGGGAGGGGGGGGEGGTRPRTRPSVLGAPPSAPRLSMSDASTTRSTSSSASGARFRPCAASRWAWPCACRWFT